MSSTRRRPRWLVPEVVQTSKMDCGPAALKCLCQGFGIDVSYGRLREACQTDVDGTSIDVIEAVANRMGLEAEQVVVPAEHLFSSVADLLPAMIIIRVERITHFVVAWRRVGRLVQVMDPAHGRRWMTMQELEALLYAHTAEVPTEALLDWLVSDEFLAPLRAQLRALGIESQRADTLIADAVATGNVERVGGLDAATRMVHTLVDAGAVDTTSDLGGLVSSLAAAPRSTGVVPESYWVAWEPRPHDEMQGTALLRGAVALSVKGTHDEPFTPPLDEDEDEDEDEDDLPPLSDETLDSLHDTADPSWRLVTQLLRRTSGGPVIATILAGLLLGGATVSFQALILRSLLGLDVWLTSGAQRLVASVSVWTFVAATTLIAAALAVLSRRVARRLELGLRQALFEKIPRIQDQFFSSRPVSDMAERAEAIAGIRNLPTLLFRIVAVFAQMLFVLIGVLWISPDAAPIVVGALATTLFLSGLAHPWLTELERKSQTHLGAMTASFLDAFLGATPIRTHGAQRKVRRGHEALVVQWARSKLSAVRLAVAVSVPQNALGFGMAWWLIFRLLDTPEQAGNALLLAYWGLQLPGFADQLARLARGVPAALVAAERLMEPLRTPEERDRTAVDRPIEPMRSPPSITFEAVTVRAGGHEILHSVDLQLAPGEHVAVVGASGSGKSTLIGLLLGWSRVAQGQLLINGRPHDGESVAKLRRHTAWVDPAVHLWNSSVFDNLTYSAHPASNSAPRVATALRRADIQGLVGRLPDGLQTALGDGGSLLSGGEGQRVRFGRALCGDPPLLALLDEPFRGLDKSQRQRMLAEVRQAWKTSTLLCATHDVGQTVDFERVLVVEGGRIVEDGCPRRLLADAKSRYASLLFAEERVATTIWGSNQWRRLWVENGNIQDRSKREREATA